MVPRLPGFLFSDPSQMSGIEKYSKWNIAIQSVLSYKFAR